MNLKRALIEQKNIVSKFTTKKIRKLILKLDK